MFSMSAEYMVIICLYIIKNDSYYGLIKLTDTIK